MPTPTPAAISSKTPINITVLPASCPPTVAEVEKPMDPLQKDGLLGDYIGGVYGTAIGIFTLIVVFFAWRTSRQVDYKTKVYQVFAEMLRTHEEIVSSIKLGDAQGREAIAIILSEFSFAYKATRKFVPSDSIWSLPQRIDIAYTYTFYGPQLQTLRILKEKYDPTLLKQLSDAIALKQQVNAKANSSRTKHRLFKGHQNRLSHYFRNLYAAYSFIESSKLSKTEKRSLGKVLRAKLSNYEQALLALNIQSHLGKSWMSTGLVSNYMPVKNVPKNFFSFDEQFDLKKAFPDVSFEWEAQ